MFYADTVGLRRSRTRAFAEKLGAFGAAPLLEKLRRRPDVPSLDAS